MRTPAAYLAAAQASHPAAEPATQALLALDLALADADRAVAQAHQYPTGLKHCNTCRRDRVAQRKAT